MLEERTIIGVTPGCVFDGFGSCSRNVCFTELEAVLNEACHPDCRLTGEEQA